MTSENRNARPLRLRIVSDGTAFGTYVLDAETGARLWGVVAIDLHVDLAGASPTATITVRNVEVDVVAGVGE